MYEQLFSPVRIGSIELPNRIAMSGMGVEMVEDDGHVREPIVAYYEARARGGAGLVITEVAAIAYPRGATTRRQISLADDRYLPGLQELTRRVHAHGAKIAVQLVHHGKVSRLDVREGRELLVPSEPRFRGAMDMAGDLTREELEALLATVGGSAPKLRVATQEDIDWLIERFAEAAERARRAGFDAIEIHAAHGYALSSFLSPASNFREDAYGGTPEKRARLLQDVIRRCKQRAGEDFTVWCRIDAHEFRTPGGITIDDAKQTAKLAQQAGADALSVSAYGDSTSGGAFTEGPLVHREAGYVEWARQIRACVEVPVIAVGRIEPALGDALIRDGHADVIAMGRKMLADPQIARKLAEGRPDDVLPCIYSYTCVAQPFFDRQVRCTVNPATTHEVEFGRVEHERAARPQRVLVVGGGPAGMQAARVAALRGHQVVLCERSARLGGALRAAARVYEPNARLLRWLERQLSRSDVEVRLDTEVTPEVVRELSPARLLVAAGGSAAAVDVPGRDLPHVLGEVDLDALLDGELVPRGASVAILGGGLVGVELAGFLAARGSRVLVLESGPHLAPQMAPPRRWHALEELRNAGVELLANVEVQAIEPDGIRFQARGSDGRQQTRTVAADRILPAPDPLADPAPAAALRSLGIPVEEIGDCARAGYLEGALHDGFHAAHRI